MFTALMKRSVQLDDFAYWTYHHLTQKEEWSLGLYHLLGLSLDKAPSRELLLSCLNADDAQSLQGVYLQAFANKTTYQSTFSMKGSEDTEFVLVERGFHEVSSEGKLLRSFGWLVDITRDIRDDFRVKSYLQLVNEQIIMSRTDLYGRIIEVSDRFCDISGYRREELIGHSHNVVRHSDMPSEVYVDLWQTIQQQQPWEGEIKNRRKDGGYYWVKSKISPDYDSQGRHVGYISLRIDITAQKQLEELSIRDELTGLYNRRFYNQHFWETLHQARQDKRWLCFLMCDIDYFKAYNDTCGHQMGDEVLKQVARVMKRTFPRTTDFVFRLGGEEFGILLEVTQPKVALTLAERLRTRIEGLQLAHSGNESFQYVTLSVGGFLIDPQHAYVEDEVFRYADSALYQAKEAGRNQVKFFNDFDFAQLAYANLSLPLSLDPEE